MNPIDHPLGRFVSRLRMHADLSACETDSILDLPFTRAARRQNAYVTREGDAVAHCAILISGYAVRHRMTGEGDRQIMAIYVPGDPLNLDHLFLPLADDALQTVQPAEVALIRHSDLRQLMDTSAEVANAIMTTMLADVSIFREWILNIGQRDAKEKIAHLLCELAIRIESQGIEAKGRPLPINQLQIAEATGLTAVHVNRTLKALQAEGLIKRKGQLVEFPDWRRLREAGDFDPYYLHIRQGPTAESAG